MKKFILLILVLFSLTSCVEIIDDLTLNNDGSGKFKYTINLSSSKTKVNSILKLDSLDGKKVPKIFEIKEKINKFQTILKNKEGITNVKIESNYDEFIIKIELDFNNLITLQKAIVETLNEMNVTIDSSNWLSFEGNKLTRKIPDFSTSKFNIIKNKEEDLKSGSYMMISRFEKQIEKTSNQEIKISKSGSASMFKTDMFSLSLNPKKLENTIYLK